VSAELYDRAAQEPLTELPRDEKAVARSADAIRSCLDAVPRFPRMDVW